MQLKHFVFPIVVACTLVAMSANSMADDANSTVNSVHQIQLSGEAAAPSVNRWFIDLQKARDEARQSDRPIMIVFR